MDLAVWHGVGLVYERRLCEPLYTRLATPFAENEPYLQSVVQF